MRMPPFTVLTYDWQLRQFAHYDKNVTIENLEAKGWLLVIHTPLTLKFHRKHSTLIVDESQGFAVYSLWMPSGNVLIVVP